MIKDKNEQNRLLGLFGDILDTDKELIEKEYMQHYIVYKKTGKSYKCYCTHCNEHYEFTSGKSRVYMTGVSHNNDGVCMKCGCSVIFLSAGYGRGNIRNSRNFAIFSECENSILVRCFKVFERFYEENLIFDYYECHRYYISPGAVQHWNVRYNFNNSENERRRFWNACKTEGGPSFSNGNLNADNSYSVINEKVVYSTKMKYAALCVSDLEPDVWHAINSNYIKYLCEFTKHPNIEFIMKTGFGYLISEQFTSGGRCGIRINYRSSNVKKMLGLGKEEMDLLAYTSCQFMSNYLWFRRELNNISESYNAAKKYGYAIGNIIEIKSSTGLSVRKILNYGKKQDKRKSSINMFMIDWRDYLNECRKLKYNLEDGKINRPKDLYKAHEHTSKLIKWEAEEELRKQMEERNKILEKLKYYDEKRGLCVMIPRDIKDIIDEGKRLDHCVGGYAKRHAEGTLTILFLRTIKKPDVPYYTVEVSKYGKIIQCRGFKNNNANNPKPQEILDFEAEYQQYLDVLFKKKGRKVA